MNKVHCIQLGIKNLTKLENTKMLIGSKQTIQDMRYHSDDNKRLDCYHFVEQDVKNTVDLTFDCYKFPF